MSAWSQTLTGRAFDFAAPVVTREHLIMEAAHGLATINRYAGALAVPYTVAQHSCLVAEAIEDETGDVELAAFGLLHDAHEAWFGDWTRPAFGALIDEIAALAHAGGAPAIVAEAQGRRGRVALRSLKRRIDHAVIQAAGLSWPRFEAYGDVISRYDLRALRTERDDLMTPPPRPWDDAIEDLPRIRTRGRLKCWSWPAAEERWRTAFERLCPVSDGREAING